MPSSCREIAAALAISALYELAEWLAAVSGAIYVPFEVVELARRVSVLSAGALIVNLIIVAIMVLVTCSLTLMTNVTHYRWRQGLGLRSARAWPCRWVST